MPGVVIDIVILALLIVRQVRPQPLSTGFTVPVILAVIGLAEFGVLLEGSGAEMAKVLKGQRSFTFPHDTGVLVAGLAGSLVIAAIGASVRARTFTLWRQDGQVWRKGGTLTVVLWVASLAAHLGYDAVVARDSALSDLGEGTLLIYFAVTLSLQRVILAARAAKLPAAEPEDSEPARP
jgi:hypothetical protein